MSAPELEDLLRPAGGSLVFHGKRGAREEIPNGDVVARGRACAAGLVRAGIAPGDRVAMTLSNDAGSVVGLLGCWYAGATVLSLPPRRGRGNGAQLDRLLAAIGCGAHLSSRRLAARFDSIPELATAQMEEGGVDQPVPDQVVPDDALVQFTSGSTGNPKGVVIPRVSLAGHVTTLASVLEVDPTADAIVTWLPLNHDMGLIGGLLVPFCVEGTSSMMTPRSFVTAPHAWLELVRRERGTILTAPDFGWRITAGAATELPADALACVRVAISGGERVQASTLDAVTDGLGPLGFSREALVPAYGLAEATLGVTFAPIGLGPTIHGDHVGLGAPLPGVEVQIGDGGVIRIRCAHGFRGYLDADGIHDPRDADGWFTTGDVGVIAGDDLVVRGRADEVVIVAGRNLCAEDVEQAVMDRLGAELSSCGAFRSPTDEGRFGIVVELVPGTTFDPQLHRRVIAAVASELETRPADVAAVPLGELPRTTSGKVRREACRDLVAARAMDQG